MCLRASALGLLPLAAVLAAATACSRATAEHQTGATKEGLAKMGLRVVIPRGWQGRIVRADRGFASPAIEAANFGLAPVSPSVEVPSPTGLKRSQVRLVLLEVGNPPSPRFPPTRRVRPLSPADFAFRLPRVPAGHAFARRHFSQGGRSFSLMVEFGARPAPEGLQRVVDELLASLRIDPLPWADPAYWRPRRRPLTLPRLIKSQRCQPSPASDAAPAVAAALGRGPAYAVLGSAGGPDLSGEIVRGGWHYHKTLWAFAPRYQGPLLIRGLRLDAPGGVRFHVGGPALIELRVPPAATGRRWRYLPSDTLFRTRGCYGFQIDGRGVSEKIVFHVSLAPASTRPVGRAPAPRLWPLPERARQQCARLQAHVRFVVLCPRRVPRPTRGWRSGDPPAPVTSDIFGSPQHPQLRTPYGLEYGYSAPVEPESGRNWRQLVWHNRPCCFLHFVVFVPHVPIPSGPCDSAASTVRPSTHTATDCTDHRGSIGRTTPGSSGVSTAPSTPPACTTSDTAPPPCSHGSSANSDQPTQSGEQAPDRSRRCPCCRPGSDRGNGEPRPRLTHIYSVRRDRSFNEADVKLVTHEQPREGSKRAPTVAASALDEIDRDPNQPRPRIRPRQVVIETPAKSNLKGRSHQISRIVIANPDAGEAERRAVPLEEDPERLRIP